MKKVAIAGAGGRMGLALVRALNESPWKSELRLVAALEGKGSPSLGKDVGLLAGIGENGIQCSDSLAPSACDVLIDFSEVDAVPLHAAYCEQNNSAMVVGVTDLSPKQEQVLKDASKSVPVLYAANMSIGVGVLAALTEQAVKALPDSDVEIIEIHHRYKKDSPSGTAQHLGELVAKTRGVDLAKEGVYDRHQRKTPRGKNDISFSSMRGGDNVGEHTVMLVADGERIEITHRASDRHIFARGALRAAVWLGGQKPALYGMRDLLKI